MLVLYQPMSSPIITRTFGFFACALARGGSSPIAKTKTLMPNDHRPLLLIFFITALLLFFSPSARVTTRPCAECDSEVRDRAVAILHPGPASDEYNFLIYSN
jgi:hypothetical protein